MVKLLIVGDVLLVMLVLACLYLQAYQSGAFMAPAVSVQAQPEGMDCGIFIPPGPPACRDYWKLAERP